MDIKERLLINRATSSLQMKTPVVEFLVSDFNYIANNNMFVGIESWPKQKRKR